MTHLSSVFDVVVPDLPDRNADDANLSDSANETLLSTKSPLERD